MGVKGYLPGALAIVMVMLLSRLALAQQRDAYDEAAPNTYPNEHAAAAEYRNNLLRITGVSMVYVANDGNIVVRVRKLTPELEQEIPKQINRCRVRVVDVEDVLRRHKHELAGIAGEDQIYSYSVEALPDGQLAIVVRVRRPDWESPIKIPTNIEGIPLRVLIAQDPLTG